MPCEDCQPCESWPPGIKLGEAIPVALVCDLAELSDINDVEFVPECYQEVDDPTQRWTRVTVFVYLSGEQQPPTYVWITPDGTVQEAGPGVAYERCRDCPIPVKVMCYVSEDDVPGCETVWANDYGAWQGGAGDQPVVSTQVACDGQTINLTWDDFVANEIVNSASQGDSIDIFSSGGPTTRQFTLSWDIPLTGPFAFIISNISPGDEDIPAISPAPDSVTPDFTVGDVNTQHQVLYNDITGINSITIDFQTVTFATGTVTVSMDESVPFTVLEYGEGIRRAVGYVDSSCANPSEVLFYDIVTGEQLTEDQLLTLSECTDDPKPLVLCERVPIVDSVDLLTFDDADNRVLKISGTTGQVIDSHLPAPGIDWANGSIFNPNTNLYYLLDTVTDEWHAYDANNIGAGSTNLGVFGGDAYDSVLSFGAFDVTNGLGYFGRNDETRYTIDFNTLTVTAVPVFNTVPVGYEPSSLSITDDGIHYVTVVPFPVGAETLIYTADKATGVLTLFNTLNGQSINGSSYDVATRTGFYGGDADTEILYHWEQPDGSDMRQIGTGIIVRTMEVTEATVIYDCTPFLRYFHKTAAGVVTIQNHDLGGEPIEVDEVFVSSCELCSQEPEDECQTKAPAQICYRVVEDVDTLIDLTEMGAWTFVSNTQMTNQIELPDGTFVNFSMDLIADFGSVSSAGPVVEDAETINLTTPTGQPNIWNLSWDVPLTGPFSFLIDDFDSDGGITINEQFGPTSGFPDNWVDYQGNILNERVTFEWVNSLIGATNYQMTIDNAAVPEDDSVNIGLVSMTVPVSTTIIRSGFAVMDCDDNITYYDAEGNILNDPDVVPCLEPNDCDNPFWTRDCIVTWSEVLCDIQITVDEVTLVVTDTVINSVNRVNGLTGAILETHAIGGSVQWTAGSFYDHNAGLYYVYDQNNGHWHRYDVFNLAAGSTNLGAFGGPPIVDGLTFGTFDPSNGRGYVGRQDDTLYEIDPTLLTVTALPSITGLLDLLEAPSSLYLDNVGRFIFMTIGTGALLGTNRVYELDITTGVATYIADLPPGIILNGGGYDLTNNSGFYGVSSGAQILYRWTNLDASNITTVGTPGTAPTSGTMDVVSSITSAEVIAEFQRVYHKNLSTGEVTSQDHDLEGADYEVLGVAGQCPVEVESSITTTCNDPLHVQQCIETWSKLLRDENCVVFNRVYHKTLEGVVTYQDHDLSGNLYTPVGEVGVGVNCYDVESHIVEIVSGGTWTPASVPANHVLTGLSMNVIIEAVDSSIIDADGNVVTNIPAGLSMSWNVSQDYNTLVPPQSIGAGTGGRMILNMTVRDES